MRACDGMVDGDARVQVDLDTITVVVSDERPGRLQHRLEFDDVAVRPHLVAATVDRPAAHHGAAQVHPIDAKCAHARRARERLEQLAELARTGGRRYG
jgi:hypothetical protein